MIEDRCAGVDQSITSAATRPSPRAQAVRRRQAARCSAVRRATRKKQRRVVGAP